jgi:hypothetical protein
MSDQRSTAMIRLSGREMTFWQLVGGAFFAYLLGVVSLVLGPLGALACMLIFSVTTVLFLVGLFLFLLQRPGTGLVVIAALGIIHYALLRKGVDAGLFWVLASDEGWVWLQTIGF